MKVKSKYKNINEMPIEAASLLNNLEDLKRLRYNTEFMPLGTEFVVYGMDVVEGNVMYRIANPPDGSFVITCLAALFEISERKVSKHWECRFDNKTGNFAIWPPSWFKFAYYHDRLSDGESEVVEDWKEAKRVLDVE
jgi:hypothetical protein